MALISVKIPKKPGYFLFSLFSISFITGITSSTVTHVNDTWCFRVSINDFIWRIINRPCSFYLGNKAIPLLRLKYGECFYFSDYFRLLTLYLGNEDVRDVVEYMHLFTGISIPFILATHIIIGKKGRGRRKVK